MCSMKLGEKVHVAGSRQTRRESGISDSVIPDYTPLPSLRSEVCKKPHHGIVVKSK